MMGEMREEIKWREILIVNTAVKKHKEQELLLLLKPTEISINK